MGFFDFLKKRTNLDIFEQCVYNLKAPSARTMFFKILKSMRQLNKEWRLRNRECDLKRKQEYRIKNRELIKFKEKLRILNNLEKERMDRHNRYRKNNRAVMRVMD